MMTYTKHNKRMISNVVAASTLFFHNHIPLNPDPGDFKVKYELLLCAFDMAPDYRDEKSAFVYPFSSHKFPSTDRNLNSRDEKLFSRYRRCRA
jgi:hypothetical protein